MDAPSGSFECLPCAQACRRIDFDFVEVRAAEEQGVGRLLVVSGIKRWADLRVTLEPLFPPGVPEFRAIEVVGRLAGWGLPAMVDFCVALPLEAVRGSKGIEIVGATKSERHVIASTWAGSEPRDRGDRIRAES